MYDKGNYSFDQLLKITINCGERQKLKKTVRANLFRDKPPMQSGEQKITNTLEVAESLREVETLR